MLKCSSLTIIGRNRDPTQKIDPKHHISGLLHFSRIRAPVPYFRAYAWGGHLLFCHWITQTLLFEKLLG